MEDGIRGLYIFVRSVWVQPILTKTKARKNSCGEGWMKGYNVKFGWVFQYFLPRNIFNWFIFLPSILLLYLSSVFKGNADMEYYNVSVHPNFILLYSHPFLYFLHLFYICIHLVMRAFSYNSPYLTIWTLSQSNMEVSL